MRPACARMLESGAATKRPAKAAGTPGCANIPAVMDPARSYDRHQHREFSACCALPKKQLFPLSELRALGYRNLTPRAAARGESDWAEPAFRLSDTTVNLCSNNLDGGKFPTPWRHRRGPYFPNRLQLQRVKTPGKRGVGWWAGL